MRGLWAILLPSFLSAPALAQTPPSVAEISHYSGLFEAAHQGDVDAIRGLAAAGADLEARDGNGRTAVHVAAFASQDDALAALADAGADMNALDADRYDAVTIAAVADDPELMSLAITLGNNPGLMTSPYDGTALIAAAHLGHAEVVRRLIAAGAPLDHVNNLGWTALIEAIVLGDGSISYVLIVQALLDAGADPRLADRLGVLPVDMAQSRGYVEIADRIRQAMR